MRNDPSESHHRIVKAKNALLLLVMLVPFIFVEILARILFPPPTLLVIPSQNFRLIYELNPFYPEINSLGMRQEELAPTALHDNFVIAVIGLLCALNGCRDKTNSQAQSRIMFTWCVALSF